MNPLLHAAVLVSVALLGTAVGDSNDIGATKKTELTLVVDLLKFGGSVTTNDQGKVTRLALGGKVTDAHLQRLKGLSSLSELDLGETRVSDSGLDHLKGLRSLKSLNLGKTVHGLKGRITYQGATKLKQALPKLVISPNMLLVAPERRSVVAVTALKEQRGGRRLYFDKSGDLVTVSFHDSTRADEGLRLLQAVKTLTRLQLSYSNVTDSGMEYVASLTNLKSLDLSTTKVSDRSLVWLKGLSKLESLRLSYKITDGGLIHLKALTNLKSLDLSQTVITDKGLAHLKGFTNLQALYLGARVTDAGLVHLKGLNKLEFLSLRGTQTTVDGILQLAALTGLKTLDLRDLNLTEKQWVKVRAALPKVSIQR